MERKLISQTRSPITHEQIRWKARKNGCEAISPQLFGVLRPNLVCVKTSMTWGYLLSFGATPPSGQEIWKLVIFASVWPKITKLVSLDSVEHAESNHPQFPSQPFWASAILNFVVNKFWRIITKLTMCLWHHALTVLKKFGGSATLWTKVINKYTKMLITFY